MPPHLNDIIYASLWIGSDGLVSYKEIRWMLTEPIKTFARSVVARRHAKCDCVVEYIDSGKIQNVHTKRMRGSKWHDTIQARISQLP